MSVEINQTAKVVGRRKIKSLRWWMLALFLLGVTVNYITRNSLGILAPELKTSLNMTTEQYSWIVASFQLAYTVFQPLCGWLIDVIGLKMGFLICASVWAVVCMMHAGAGTRFQLAVLRFFMGSAEAAATPANAKAISDWFPKKGAPYCGGLGWRGLLHWRNVSTTHYRTGPCGARLARRISLLQCLSHGLGAVMVALLPFTGYSPQSE